MFEDDVSVSLFRSMSLGISSVISAIVLLSAWLEHSKSLNILLIVLASFWVSYVMISLCFQVLESSVLAIYVCFAQHPESMKSQYPIVHHRLERITEFSSPYSIDFQ